MNFDPTRLYEVFKYFDKAFIFDKYFIIQQNMKIYNNILFMS